HDEEAAHRAGEEGGGGEREGAGEEGEGSIKPMDAAHKSVARMTKNEAEPLELILGLCKWMNRLTPKAWKVVSWIAHESIRQYQQEWKSKNDPRLLVARDIAAAVTIPGPTSEPVGGDLYLVEDRPTYRVRISLNVLCANTGLSKSAVAEAVNEC